jgi:hypothetical protein
MVSVEAYVKAGAVVSRFSAANGLFGIATNGYKDPGKLVYIEFQCRERLVWDCYVSRLTASARLRVLTSFSAANGLFGIATWEKVLHWSRETLGFQCRERLVWDCYENAVSWFDAVEATDD